ncbi:hypothetical protein TraAM80_08204 [Trypanosoma rangeli]|uniref:Uncharacterized protein n=1 Tax=Trypanosoma rangeli TaxID=5698 RepID=A0A3R7M4R7_TRYRA|nr:uncharacterized protein TraAM80_08204 [Trypanosoma rangeli]RNE99407.1 hypothetical protein TraAM80_08204 [Trypanosoma rangeli]|eukprot:RNE99407.1 hypothetical protein TraAM80_08204 [Trypanosoma rangeli]
MPLVPIEKPSARFHVQLSGSSMCGGGVVSPCTGCCNTSDKTQFVAPSSITGAVVSLGVTSEDACGNNSCQPRRYGGAIVRLSELQRLGGVLLPTALSSAGPLVEGDSAQRRPSSDMLSRAMGLADPDEVERRTLHSDVRMTRTSRARDVSSRNGKRCMSFSHGEQTSRSSSKKTVGAMRSKLERVRGKNNSLQLKPNGEPYEHRWSTVNGRRQLHYGGHTYTGRAAHQLWGKIKAALSSKGLSSSKVPSRARSIKRQNPNGKKRARTGEILAPDAIPPVPIVTSHLPLQHVRPIYTPPTYVSTTRTRLLLDDEGESEPKGDAGADVVLASRIKSRSVNSSDTSITSSLASMEVDGDRLTSSVSSLSSVSSFSSASLSDAGDGCNHDSNVTMGCVKSQDVGSATTRRPPVLVEHEGWVYPAELLPVLCKKQDAGTSLARKVVENAGTLGTDSAGTGNAKNAGSLAQKSHEVESNPKARGLTVLGWDGVGDAPLALYRHRNDATRTPNLPNSLRYEEMDVLDDFLDVDAADLFVAGDEIGGMRFAP